MHADTYILRNHRMAFGPARLSLRLGGSPRLPSGESVLHLSIAGETP